MYEESELRLVQERVVSSAANAEVLNFPAVPLGKLWTVIGVGYIPDAAETQVIAFSKNTRTGSEIALLNPISLALNPALATFIEQGTWIELLPGEFIRVRRAAHTVGTAMAAVMEFIESDMPLYTYTEPQVRKREAQAIGSLRQQIGKVTGPKGGGISTWERPVRDKESRGGKIG